MGAGILAALWIVLAQDVGEALAAPPPVAVTVTESGACTVLAGTLADVSDGDYQSFYSVTACPAGYFIGLDAGAGNVMAEVRVLYGFNDSCGLTVEVSEDGGEWVAWHVSEDNSVPLRANRWTSYVVPPVRYVRLHDPNGVSCEFPGAMHIWEIEAFGQDVYGVNLPVSEVSRYAEEVAGAGPVNNVVEVGIALVIVYFILRAVLGLRRVLWSGSDSFAGGGSGGAGYGGGEPGDMA